MTPKTLNPKPYNQQRPGESAGKRSPPKKTYNFSVFQFVEWFFTILFTVELLTRWALRLVADVQEMRVFQ